VFVDGFTVSYMAKITHGPTVTNARGKIGRAVFTKTRGGNVAKALSIAAEGVGPHNLLSTAHLDTTPATPPARGSLIVAQTATPKWKELPLGTNGKVLGSDGTDAKWVAPAAAGVTSVGLALPAELDVTGSPVTGAGTLTGAWADQDAKKILAGPISGAADTPAFRLLATTDLPLLDGARVTHDVDQHIAINTHTTLAFNSERYDNGGLHSTVTNNSRLTAQKAGVYLITCNIAWEGAAGHIRILSLKLNATTYIARNYEYLTFDDEHHLSLTTLYKLAVTDYVQALVFHDVVGGLDILQAANFSPEFAMQQLTQD